MTDIRWQQRLDSFGKALDRLREPTLAGVDRLSQLEKEGFVQRFEFTFELAWKTMKDYLTFEGVALEQSTPRHVIKQAFASGVIPDGQIWIDMLDARNAMSHQYDEQKFDQLVPRIAGHFLPPFIALRAWFETKRNG